MKNYIKYITIILIAFVMMIGINVKADDIYLDSDGTEILIKLPIHKTDINKKGLEGAEFTLKDFNNTISYKSEDKHDGDYLIEVYKYYEPSQVTRKDMDIDYRIEDYTGIDEVLTEILDVIPTKYSDVFRKAEDEEDLYKMLDLPIALFNEGEKHYNIGFYIPLKLEETKVSAESKAKDIIVPAFVHLYFNYGRIHARLSYTPGYWKYEPFEMVPAYFEYDEEIDYEKIFDNINNNALDAYYDDTILELFEENGAIVDNDCEIREPVMDREDLEARFDPEIEEYYCPINLVGEKEDIKVNPETYGTLALILVLIGGATGFILIRKNKEEA